MTGDASTGTAAGSAHPAAATAPAGARRPPHFSLIVSTLGRTTPLARLLESLVAQDWQDFEVVLVDQNTDDRLDGLVSGYAARLALRRVHSARGLSLGRNAGLAQARAPIVAFPDDDCWYAPDTLQRVAERFAQPGVDALSTWIGEDPGAPGLGRRPWGLQAAVDHSNLFALPISASLFVRRAPLHEAAITFDERIGAGRRIGAGEETWFVHQLLEAGLRVRYDGTIAVFHPMAADVDPVKAWSYGLGFGFVCRRLIAAGRWQAVRPLGRALLRSAAAVPYFAVRGEPRAARTFAARLGSIVAGLVVPGRYGGSASVEPRPAPIGRSRGR